MDDAELAERNYKVGLRTLRYMKRVIDSEVVKLNEISGMITYGKDGDVLISITKKLKSSSEQIIHMISRFNDLKGEIMIPIAKLF